MRGRPPKDPDVRTRRNKASTAAELAAVDAHGMRAPSLPKSLFAPLAIHPLTRRWWRVLWRSPMAPRWLEADVERLYLVAKLRNAFFHEEDPSKAALLAGRLANLEVPLGVTVMDRRRLDWRIEGARPADPPSAPPPAAAPAAVSPPPGDDPRKILRMVQ